jgi:choline kinase
MSEKKERCLIIAAGLGSRLSSLAPSKPLLEVCGRALIERVVGTAAEAGVGEFVVVTGHERERVEAYVDGLAGRTGLRIATVFNEEWRRENGLSVLKAADLVGERFLLLMSDHIFSPEIVRRLLAADPGEGGLILAVDRRIGGNPFIDEVDVTKVMVSDGRILAIGKSLERYNAYDTGAFLCTRGLLESLELSRQEGDASLTGGVRKLAARGKAFALDIGDCFWMDVDDEAALRKAERALGRAREPGKPGKVAGG